MASLLDVLGGNSANTDRKQQLTAYGDLNSLFNQLQKYSSQDRTAGAIDTGRASKFYSSLLSGDPSRVAAAVGPEANAERQGNQTLLKQISQFGNRGGGTNSTAAELGVKSKGDLTDSILRARSGAAGGSERIGSEQSNRAASEKGQAGEVASTLLSGSLNSRSVSQALHDEAVKKWSDLIQQVLTAVPTGGAGAPA